MKDEFITRGNKDGPCLHTDLVGPFPVRFLGITQSFVIQDMNINLNYRSHKDDVIAHVRGSVLIDVDFVAITPYSLLSINSDSRRIIRKGVKGTILPGANYLRHAFPYDESLFLI